MVATSSNSPNTVQVLEQKGIETLGTPGKGYSSDLNFLLQNMDEYTFVVSGDLPLLDEEIIQVMVEKFSIENVWTSFLTSKKFLNSLGLESELVTTYDNIECAYTGISIINADKIKDSSLVKENYIILDDKRISFNLNTKKITNYSTVPEIVPIIRAFPPVGSDIILPQDLHVTGVEAYE